MSISLTPEKTDRGWVIEIPTEMASAMNVAEGSLAVLHTRAGTFEVEVLPPPSPELERSVERIHEKYKDAFAEMKRLGD
jgi:hypothetical protein